METIKASGCILLGVAITIGIYVLTTGCIVYEEDATTDQAKVMGFDLAAPDDDDQD